MNDGIGFDLSVNEITPRRGGDEGKVTFRFQTEGQDLLLHVAYFDADSYDDAVKQAAQNLVRIAEAMAAGAKQLAE